VEHILAGAGLILRNRRFWRYIYGPLAISGGLFLLLASIGLVVVNAIWAGVLGRFGQDSGPLSAIAPLLYLVLLFVYSGVLFLAITSMTSSFMWERLSAAVEMALGGTGRMDSLPKSVVIGDSIARTMLAIGVAFASLCCAFIVPVIAPLLLAGGLGIIDYTAAAYLRRNVLLRQQMRAVWKLPGVLGFLVASALISSVPLLNVLMLPAMVAGGTIMVMRGSGGISGVEGQ
jgi:CysZ protein